MLAESILITKLKMLSVFKNCIQLLYSKCLKYDTGIIFEVEYYLKNKK